jgi:hypothetical protein
MFSAHEKMTMFAIQIGRAILESDLIFDHV